MEITMKEAILQGKDFEFKDSIYQKIDGVHYRDGTKSLYSTPSVKWILENQEKMVEVEDNYWDSDGRYIKEHTVGEAEYWFISSNGLVDSNYVGNGLTMKPYFETGNCFKDKTSAQAELQRLKDAQKARMK